MDKIILTLLLLLFLSGICVIFSLFIPSAEAFDIEDSGTKYIDRGNYIEVLYYDGSSVYVGNENTEGLFDDGDYKSI